MTEMQSDVEGNASYQMAPIWYTKMAHKYQLRAESALEHDRVDEAVRLFALAMELTPENEMLR